VVTWDKVEYIRGVVDFGTGYVSEVEALHGHFLDTWYHSFKKLVEVKDIEDYLKFEYILNRRRFNTPNLLIYRRRFDYLTPSSASSSRQARIRE
jgi:hypothetical protein